MGVVFKRITTAIFTNSPCFTFMSVSPSVPNKENLISRFMLSKFSISILTSSKYRVLFKYPCLFRGCWKSWLKSLSKCFSLYLLMLCNEEERSYPSSHLSLFNYLMIQLNFCVLSCNILVILRSIEENLHACFISSSPTNSNGQSWRTLLSRIVGDVALPHH